MPVHTSDPRPEIRDQARRLGFDAVGFASARLPESAGAELEAFLAAGHHGDMAWLKQRAAERRSPDALWPETVSVIVLGVNYAPAAESLPTPGAGDHEGGMGESAARGQVSVYAANRDYHEVIKPRLKALARWLIARFGGEVKVFVDTAPVMEKPLAVMAGLGWAGRHTNLVSRQFGSWLFLGEIFTTLVLEPDPPAVDRCGRCRRCLDACPTGALLSSHRIDARACISYLTIEHKGPIPLGLRPLLGTRIYGCDACLAVCPWNRFAPPTNDPAFQPRPDLPRPALAPLLAPLLALDEAGFRARFAKSPIKRIGRSRFLRNVLIAAGNTAGTGGAEAALITACRACLDDPDPLIRGTAVWALGRLLPPACVQTERQRRLTDEPDTTVRAEWQTVPVDP